MSEYQYYEFQTIDRQLTDRQMRELRTISSRATISRTRFSNYDTYGDLKANPRDLLVQYFDASCPSLIGSTSNSRSGFRRPPSICGDCGATQQGSRWMCIQRVGMWSSPWLSRGTISPPKMTGKAGCRH